MENGGQKKMIRKPPLTKPPSLENKGRQNRPLDAKKISDIQKQMKFIEEPH